MMKTAIRCWLVAGIVAIGVLPVRAAVLFNATGGTTTPGAWTSGNYVTDQINYAMSSAQAAFQSAGLWDSGTSTVGGGSVTGTLYYAFFARPLDREGDTRLPGGASHNGSLQFPGNSFGGGMLLNGTTPQLNIDQYPGYYAHSYFRGSPDAPSGGGDMTGTRYDLSPNRLDLVQVTVQYTGSGNANVTILDTYYDNGSSTPYASNTTTLTNVPASFDTFAFISGHKDAYANRWSFDGDTSFAGSTSAIAFATTAAEAYNTITAVPEPSTIVMFVGCGLLGLLGYFGYRRRN